MCENLQVYRQRERKKEREREKKERRDTKGGGFPSESTFWK